MEESNQNQKAMDEKFCASCGKIVKEKAEICPFCGVRLMAPPTTPVFATNGTRSRLLAALLAFFLGGIGIHKFYLGQHGQGVLYLLFFWTFIPSIIAFFEFIILLVTSDDDFNKRFNAAS